MHRRDLLIGAGATAGLMLARPVLAADDQAVAAMKRAARFMVERASHRGGYVWQMLPDGSRRWGELEAHPTMVWVQAPGTPTMGQLFLDAYHATGDEYYYQAAAKAAAALVAGQTAEGGWHYFIDFDPASRRRWYQTIGRNAWRLEEFQHDWGNATFDDSATSMSAEFLLRFWAEKRDASVKPALDRAIGFVLKSQYANGGWPQRWPVRNPIRKPGHHDYTGYITFNDDVIGGNIDFLLNAYRVTGDLRCVAAVRRSMEVYLAAQGKPPQAGWALQHTPSDLKPAAARTYEPRALTTHTTAANARQCLAFYSWTGDRRFLDAVPPALDWLDSVRLADPSVSGGRGSHPTFVELGTNRPLFIHRRGSNVVNGRYYADRDPARTIGHYSSFRRIDTAAIRREHARLAAADPATLTRDSPLSVAAGSPLPRYYVVGAGRAAAAEVAAVTGKLDAQGRWLTPLPTTSNPYAGDGSPVHAPGDYSATLVGDRTDTSPHPAAVPVQGISTQAFIDNMGVLIRAVRPA
jgi:PelA/Pel-15E family pectate lyase